MKNCGKIVAKGWILSFTKGDEKSTEEDEKSVKAKLKYHRIAAASRNHYSNQQTIGYTDLQQFRYKPQGTNTHPHCRQPIEFIKQLKKATTTRDNNI